MNETKRPRTLRVELDFPSTLVDELRRFAAHCGEGVSLSDLVAALTVEALAARTMKEHFPLEGAVRVELDFPAALVDEVRMSAGDGGDVVALSDLIAALTLEGLAARLVTHGTLREVEGLAGLEEGVASQIAPGARATRVPPLR